MDNHIEELEKTIAKLSEENLSLKKKIAFFENHPNVVAGIRGESFVSRLVSGAITEFNAPHDIETNCGLRIEVKYSKLNLANRKQTGTTKRWSWKNVFGSGGGKKYDRLILIGEADQRHLHSYLQPDSPYVIFDIGFEDVMQLTSKTEHKQRLIQLSTNPTSVRSRAKILYAEYQIKSEYLTMKYGL
ncbi:hypothetical protein [Shewanella psychrotolerans]|uniref:hypothetical protein n=1 Tax=Shewanella psychrotolerans TaxID=2864206 RepID=UPI001C65F8AF|nr:hypothetical protein [Shewanella psychrotolerans]QYK02249.1 hypothetical protein K0I62_04545 [Shewanella psychrotolerans]